MDAGVKRNAAECGGGVGGRSADHLNYLFLWKKTQTQTHILVKKMDLYQQEAGKIVLFIGVAEILPHVRARTSHNKHAKRNYKMSA